MLWFYILRVSEPWHCLLPRQHLDDVYYIAVNVNLPCFNTTVDKNLGFHEFCIWNSYSSFHNIRKICFFCRVGWHCLQGIAIHSEAFLFFLCSNHKGWRFAKWWSSSPNKKSSLSLCCPIESLTFLHMQQSEEVEICQMIIYFSKIKGVALFNGIQ